MIDAAVFTAPISAWREKADAAITVNWDVIPGHVVSKYLERNASFEGLTLIKSITKHSQTDRSSEDVQQHTA